MGSEEVLETSGLRKGLLLVASPTIPSQQLLLQLTLLLLHVAEQFGLHRKHLLKVLRYRWRGWQFRLSGPTSTTGVAASTGHLQMQGVN